MTAEISVRLSSARKKGLAPDLGLSATLYLPSQPELVPAPGLVVGHGAASRGLRHQDFCREACKRGFVVLALDFRGHGASQGRGDGPLEQDVLAAVGFLHDHPAVDGHLVCYRGSSMGGFYGLKAAPAAAFTAMVLLCPAGESAMLEAIRERSHAESHDDTESPNSPSATQLNHGGLCTTPRWDIPALRSYFEHQNSRDLAARVECPVLLVHARQDDVIPAAHSLMLAQHLSVETTLLLLEGGTHTSAQHSDVIHRYTTAWLRDQVERARQQMVSRREE